ncbi:hypothetical protein CK203_043527 [Vitis vinifera]|uniref:Uncharacterized protein n=1 Tax=Vitis vinifera TaxID=29760 RepID=A0A438HR61_VITVI|nr:hypothetical protein CK203_096592 [Vitis vinifera]RVW86943.1 hypothetical protein CK203_043527 [Vitis vinifera]
MIWHLAHLERRVLKLSYEAVALIVVIGVCRVITFADVAKPYWFTLCGSLSRAIANIRPKAAST